MICLRYLFAGCLAGLSLMCHAAGSPVPLFEITAEPGATVQWPLGPEVYEFSRRSNLSDLVLLDAQGNRLPFRFSVPVTEHQESQYSTRIGFYPVTADIKPENLRIEGGTAITLDGRTLRIETDRPARAHTEAEAPAFYLLDIRDLEHPVTRLRIEWQPGEGNHYRKLAVAGSRDLQRWTPLAEHTLVQLQQDQQQLIHNQIPLSFKPGDYHYLRLTRLDNKESLPMSGIFLEASLNTAQNHHNTWSLAGQLARDQLSVAARNPGTKAASVAAWEFERREPLAINQLNLDVGTQSYSDTIMLFSRANAKQRWQLVYRGLWFNTHAGMDWQRSQDMQISSNSHSLWRLELNETARNTVNPELVFSHPMQVLQFVANPFGPFTLALDNSTPDNYPRIQAQIFEQILGNKNPAWKTPDSKRLNPIGFQPPAEARVIDWKLLLFWLTLAMAVLVLIIFALRLLRQMREPPQNLL